MDLFEQVCRAIADGAHSVWRSFSAYLRLDTVRLCEEAQCGTAGSRWKLTGRLIAVVSVVMALTLIAVGKTQDFNFLEVGRAAFMTVAWALVLALPVYACVRIIVGLKIGHLVVNIVSIQQTLLIILGAAVWLSLMFTEPSRTDFALLRDGIGQRTVAYEKICGDLKRRAELLSMSWDVSGRTEATSRDNRELLRDLRTPPASLQELRARLGGSLLRIERMEAELAQSERELGRQDQMILEGRSAEARFHNFYPTVRWIERVAAIGVLVLISMSSIHLWKAVVWPTPTWPGKARAVISLLEADLK